jgi:hypothetical protein
MSNEQNNQQQGGGKEGQKIRKNFANLVSNLMTILGAKDEKSITKKVKVKSDGFNNLMQNLFKEEQEQKEKEFVTELKDLIKKKAEYDRWVVEETNKFNKAQEAKMKEFSDKAQKLFNDVENWGGVLASYGQAGEAVLEAAAEEDIQDGEGQDQQ